MSNYIPKGHNYAVEIAQSYSDATTTHTAAVVDGVDDNALEIGYSLGYKDARDFHRAAVLSGNDASGQSRGYLDGYAASATFHTESTQSGNDGLGNLRGYANGYSTGHAAGLAAAIAPRWALRTPSNQSISQNVWTKVNFNSVSAAVIGVTHSTGSKRITITEAGTYEVAAGWEFTRVGGSASNVLARGAIYKNGGAYRYGDTQFRSSATTYGMVAVREEIPLNVGDYLEVYALASFDGTRVVEQVSADSTDAFFIGFKQD